MPLSLCPDFADKLCSAAVPQVCGVDGPSSVAASFHRNVPFLAAALFRDAGYIVNSARGCIGRLQSEIALDGDDSTVAR